MAKTAHAVVQEAKDAGVWVYGGGLKDPEEASVVATDGMVTDGPCLERKEYLGGFAVVDVPSREEALEWAAKIAVACRSAQEVRELLYDPDVRSKESRRSAAPQRCGFTPCFRCDRLLQLFTRAGFYPLMTLL